MKIGGIYLKRSFYVYSNGKLSRKDNTLFYKTVEGEKKSLPIENISEIYVMCEMDFNTKLINILSKYGIIVHFFNYYDFYSGSFYPRESLLAGSLLVKQVEHYTDYNKRLVLGKEFVTSAYHNIHRNLRYYNDRGKKLTSYMRDIENLSREINACQNIEQLMGIEGNIRRVYYESYHTIIDREIDFERRVKRPPDNMMNTMISYINSIIYTKVLSEIYRTQLNPTISYLHEPGVRRFSLSLDISEIFKPLIGDRLIFSLLNKNQITENDFTEELGNLHLSKKGSQTIMAELDKRLQQTIMHKDLGRKVSYQYLIRLECYKLIKHLIGEKQYESFKMWW